MLRKRKEYQAKIKVKRTAFKYCSIFIIQTLKVILALWVSNLIKLRMPSICFGKTFLTLIHMQIFLIVEVTMICTIPRITK